ncbi:sensor histidine kinase [Paraflavisolibacter sp. H34]|uniref:sensor histidine kinase n=1 Tax=Huijunlia imazamoxiresistens TaxID=3127457 RepID=UPI00301A2C45
MIKDTLFKAFCIPLLGIIIPLLSGLARYGQFSAVEVLAANVFFITASYLVWQGAVKIVLGVRRWKPFRQRVFLKMFVLCTCTAAYGFALTGTSAFLWQKIFTGSLQPGTILTCGLLSAAFVLFLTLLYETLFLSKERELDEKIVDQLDHERAGAEMKALKRELDPHFLFNSLTTVSHLIAADPDKAQVFTQKLARVFRYFLINKDRELISLEEEFQFVEDYFYLLRIRYEEKLQLTFRVHSLKDTAMVLPCTLQLLIENAVKHNRFTENDPLHISIMVTGDYVSVENNVRPKPYALESTKTGLANLNDRYRVYSNKNINVHRNDDMFRVQLPLIRQNSL